ncbi:hypothetical protein GCM10010409_07460 [Mycolicibacterium diernhoferi]
MMFAQHHGNAARVSAQADIALAAAYNSDVAIPGDCERMSKRRVNGAMVDPPVIAFE